MLDLRRRVAEAKGWKMRPEYGMWVLWSPEWDRIRWSGPASLSLDGAWARAANDRALPDWPDDPAAALGLLAGDRLEWTAHVWTARQLTKPPIRMMHIYFRADDRSGNANVVIDDGDEAAAFAQAACEAWLAWQGADSAGEG